VEEFEPRLSDFGFENLFYSPGMFWLGGNSTSQPEILILSQVHKNIKGMIKIFF